METWLTLFKIEQNVLPLRLMRDKSPLKLNPPSALKPKVLLDTYMAIMVQVGFFSSFEKAVGSQIFFLKR